jgi:hypothetical protein
LSVVQREKKEEMRAYGFEFWSTKGLKEKLLSKRSRELYVRSLSSFSAERSFWCWGNWVVRVVTRSHKLIISRPGSTLSFPKRLSVKWGAGTWVIYFSSSKICRMFVNIACLASVHWYWWCMQRE